MAHNDPTGTFATRSLANARSRLRRSLLVMASVATLCFASAAAAVSSDSPTATLAPLQPDAARLATTQGQDLPLQVVKQVDGQGVAGQTVDWTVSGPGKVDLAPAHSTTLAKSDSAQAGTAGTVFHASVPGDYIVTASTQKNPGCATAGCQTWVSTRFAVNVAAAEGGASTAAPANHDHTVAAGAVILGGALAAALIGSSGGGDHNVAPQARDLVAVAGDGQAAGANAPLSQALVVRAISGGAPTPGLQIQWSASGGASLSSATSTTDGSGQASVMVTSVGPGPGPVVITAARTDYPSATASFTASVLQPSLNLISGNGQTGYPGSNSSPLTVQALLGANPQNQIPIAWAVVSGSASVLSISNGSVTDVNGNSSAIIRFGSTNGPVVVTATRTDDGLSQTFNLNNASVLTLGGVSGNNQAACPNQALPQPLVVSALTNNLPAAGVTINWLASSPATLSAPSTVTNGGGQASVNVTSIGPDYQAVASVVSVTASRADDPTATTTFTAQVPASTLAINSGNGQSGPVGSNSAPMIVQLLDGCGNPIAGQPVAWVVTSGSGTLLAATTTTDASGIAHDILTYGTTPQAINVQASALGGGLVVNFAATSTTNGISIGTGNNQTGAPGALLPQPLTVTVNPALAGVPVSFTVVSGSATVNPATALTNSSGTASAQLQLGYTPGPVVVQAVAGSSVAVFNATVSGGTASALSVVSGNNQFIPLNTASQPLVVQLNAGGSPLPGMSINWSSSGGTLSASSTSTGANGQTSVTLTPNGSGPITVTATFPGANVGGVGYPTTSVSFSENASLASVAAPTSNDQSVAHALDAACNALQNLPSRTQQQQDLLNQCLALTVSGTVASGAVDNAIHQMIPAVSQAQTSTAVTASTAQFSNLAGRMQAVRGGAQGISFAGLAFNNDTASLGLGDVGAALLGASDAKSGDNASTAGFSRWGFFGSGQIQRQDARALGFNPGYHTGSNGLTFGADYRVSDDFVVGGALGWTHQSTTLAAGQGSMSMHGWSLSGYATWYQKNDWYLDGAVTWSNNRFNATRIIAYTLPLPGGGNAVVNQAALSSSGGNDFAASATFGRDFHYQALAYGVYGKLQYDRTTFDAFSENTNVAMPGSGLALRVGSHSTTSFASVLGAKMDYNVSTSWGVWVPHAELEWQHEYRTDPGAFTAYFLDDPTNTPILIRSDKTDSNFFRFGTGMSFVFTQGRSAFLLYNRTFGRTGISAYNVSLGFRLEF
ncbi:MAG: autotransporter domain-containing protein [Proteobacteria bacterium]|nr:autotransporter domain-containing protein [Pseudomonadota bacterium]